MVLTKPQLDVAHNPWLCLTLYREFLDRECVESVSHLLAIHPEEHLVLRHLNIHLRTARVRFSGDPHYVRLRDQFVNIYRAVLSVDVSPAVQNQPAGDSLHRY